MSTFTVTGIRKSFSRKKHILEDISLQADAGECIGILGANGCGKSTLLSILAGTLSADSGAIAYEEASVSAKKTNRSPLPIGYVPQESPLIPELNAYDNLRLWYCDGKLSLEQELKNGFLSLLGIPDFLSVPVKKMSGGMKKRLSIGCCIATAPKVLLLDEPGAALDLVCKEQIEQYFKKYLSAGNIILIATHEEREIAFCNRLYLLKNGTLSPFSYSGDIHELTKKL